MQRYGSWRSVPGHAGHLASLFTSPPDPAGLVIKVQLGLGMTRLGADHRAGGSLQRWVLVAAERQPRIAIAPVGGSTRTARLNRHRTFPPNWTFPANCFRAGPPTVSIC